MKDFWAWCTVLLIAFGILTFLAVGAWAFHEFILH